MQDNLPTADDLYNSTTAAPPPSPELPPSDDLYDSLAKQADEERFYPTVGRVVKNAAIGALSAYGEHAAQKGQIEEAVTHPLYYNAKLIGEEFLHGSKQLSAMIASPFLKDEQVTDLKDAGDLTSTPNTEQLLAKAKAEGRELTLDEKKQIGAEAGAAPLTPFIQTVFSPLAPLSPLLEGAFYAAEKEGVSKGNLALANTGLLAVGLARVPHLAEEALAAGAHLPEEVVTGAREMTPEEGKVMDLAAQNLPPAAPAQTIHDVARQVAPETFQEYDNLTAQRSALGNMMRDLTEKNQQDVEASSPYNEQIAALEQSMAGGSKRQKKIAQGKIDDLREQHDSWVKENLAPSLEMEQIRQKYNEIDYRMRDMAADVSAAYRAARERLPEARTENPLLSSPEAEIAPRGSPEALAKEAETATGQLKTVLKRTASPKVDPIKTVNDIEWAKENERPDIVTALTNKLEGVANTEAVKTYLPKGIAGHVSQELQAAGRPAEEADAAAKLVEAHYKARSERFGGKKGTPEEMYARDSAVIKAGRNARAREFAQGKGKELKQSPAYQSAADHLKGMLSDLAIRNKDEFVGRAARGELTGVERRRMSSDALSAARDLEKAYDKIPDKELFQAGDYGLPGFYSKMYRGLEEKLNASGTPEQMLQQIESLAKNGTFKKDELFWSGLPEYLKGLPEQGKKVSKEQIMDWLDRNKLEVGEHILDQDTEGESQGFTENDVYHGGLEARDLENDDPHAFDQEVDHFVEMWYEDNGNDPKEYFEREGETPYVEPIEMQDGTTRYTWNEDAIRDDAMESARSSLAETGEKVEEVNVGDGAYNYKIYVDENAGSWRIIDEDSGNAIADGTGRNADHMQGRAHDALWDYLRENDIARYSDDEDYSGGTKYADYQEEGPKEDYAEMLITLPEIPDKGVSQHGWPQEAQDQNILMHLRFNTREDKGGAKTLFIEEMQSDWHQQGRKQGYRSGTKEMLALEENRQTTLAAAKSVIEARGLLGFDSMGQALSAVVSHEDFASRWDVEGADDIKVLDDYREAAEKLNAAMSGVANAPFSDLNKYTELGMKRMLGYAAEKGYDKIAWTTGEQQARRWSHALQRDVQEIRVSPDSTAEGVKLKVLRTGGGNVSDFIAKQVKDATYDEKTGYVTMKPESIDQVFGKGLQEQISERITKMQEGTEQERPTLQEKYDAVKSYEEAEKAYKNRDRELEGTRENLRLAEEMEKARDRMEGINAALEGVDEKISGLDLRVSDKGMIEVYDKVMVNVANSIIKKFGLKVKPSEFDLGGSTLELDKATVPTIEAVHALRDGLMKRKTAAELTQGIDINSKWHMADEDRLQALDKMVEDHNADPENGIYNYLKSLRARPEMMREAFGVKTKRMPVHEQQWSFDLTPELKNSAREGQTLFQGARGKIRLGTQSARAAITLMKNADASTFIHETGHHWLDELLRDAEDMDAPADLKADAATVRKWLGAEGEITTRQHERFARGFERYLMEGIAPSRGLAEVFAKFKDWLTQIYKTVQKLRSPITDDIRHVFDRLLSSKPEKTVIEPDSQAGKMMADIHEADARLAPPEMAAATADNIERELDKTLILHNPEIHDAIKAAESGETPEVAPASPGTPANSDRQPEPAGRQRGAKPTGGDGSEGEGTGERAASSITRSSAEPPESANAILPSDDKFIDKAGNIRLDNLGTPEDVNQVIRESADQNAEFISARRGVISDRDADSLADALGMDRAMLNMRKIGQAYSAEQVLAARKLLIRSATNVRDLMLKASDGTDNDVMAYAEAKTQHMMIQEQVAGITAEAGRALRAFRALEGSTETKLLGDFLKETTGKDLFQLKQEAQLGASLDTPGKVSKFINDSKKPSFMDMIREYWLNALLSGPKTHIANIMSNALVALYSVPETAAAAAIGKVMRSEDSVVMGEAKARIFGILQGAKDGARAAKAAFKTEKIDENKLEQKKYQAIPSKKVKVGNKELEIGGKQIRIPGRLLTAEDEFFKAIASRQELYALAVRQATREGGDIPTRVAEIMLNPSEEMMKSAHQAALYQTFQKNLGPTGLAIQRFANSHPALKFVIPFIRTPINIVKYAGERTPLGFFSKEVRANLSGKKGTVARDTQMARISMGTTLGLASLMMAINGQITGGGPTDTRAQAVLRQSGWQPYSVKIGNSYYSYNRMDPLGIILGVSADLADIGHAVKEADAKKLTAMIMAAISKNLTSKTWLQGPSDLIQAITDSDRYGENYVKKFAGTIVPSAVAQYAQAEDPIMREARTIIDGIKARTPGLSEMLLPKRDIWGEPIRREGSAGPDLLSPIYETSQKNDPVIQRMIALNYSPARVDRKINGIELSDKQYDDYARIAGRLSKMMLTNIIRPGFELMPEEEQKKIIRDTLEQARATARSMVKFNNTDILQKIINKKALR